MITFMMLWGLYSYLKINFSVIYNLEIKYISDPHRYLTYPCAITLWHIILNRDHLKLDNIT